jgi:hypothetical protein
MEEGGVRIRYCIDTLFVSVVNCEMEVGVERLETLSLASEWSPKDESRDSWRWLGGGETELAGESADDGGADDRGTGVAEFTRLSRTSMRLSSLSRVDFSTWTRVVPGDEGGALVAEGCLKTCGVRKRWSEGGGAGTDMLSRESRRREEEAPVEVDRGEGAGRTSRDQSTTESFASSELDSRKLWLADGRSDMR